MTKHREALTRILLLDPVHEGGYHDEWTEADCFRKAVGIAAEALGEVDPYASADPMSDEAAPPAQ